MKNIWVLSLAMICMAILAFADSIVRFDVEIDHPRLNFKNPSPLIITMKTFWNGRVEPEINKLVITPTYFTYFDMRTGKEVQDDKSSYIIYHDAYELPNKSGFLLAKIKTGYETDLRLEDLKIYTPHNSPVSLEPHGSHIFWTKDGKHLVTVQNPSPYGTDEETYALYFYNLQSKKYEDSKKMGAGEYKNLNLIPAK